MELNISAEKQHRREQEIDRQKALETVKDLSSGYTNIGIEIGELVTEKNQAYGDSFNQSEKIIAVLYPNGIPKEGYTDFLTIVRVIDKLFRIATDRDALGESPWRDIAGYSLLAIERQERNKKKAELEIKDQNQRSIIVEETGEILSKTALYNVLHRQQTGFGLNEDIPDQCEG